MAGSLDNSDIFKNIYYDTSSPGGYGGARRFLSEVNKNDRDEATQWLTDQEAYTIHKPVRLRFARRQTIAPAPRYQVQADLMDVSTHAKDNNDITFLLTVVDVFSKKASVEALKSKHGKGVASALASVYVSNPFRKLQTDKGKEFLNRDVKKFCEENNIVHFTSENSTIKASIVERFNRTIRSKIHRYLTAKNTKGYIDVLPNLVRSYNNSRHGSTGITPNEIDNDDVENVYSRLYEPDKIPRWIKKSSNSSILPGDFVRISKSRGTFDRGYTPNWSTEVFVVASKVRMVKPDVYRIRDLAGESINGTFYLDELQKVSEPKVFKIEKVLRRRSVRGKRQMLVKWLGYPKKFNEWIAEEQVVN